MGDDERTIICFWLAAGLVLIGIALPLVRFEITIVRIIGAIGAAVGAVSLGVGIWLLILYNSRAD
jgi:hypothetical protein